MAKLGSAFSDAERRKAAARRLSPGAVVRIDVRFPEGPRSKYLVVASVDDECRTLIVNSRIHPLVERNEDLAVCQVRIDQARHDFLSHDSFLACHQVLRLPTSAVLGELVDDMGRLKGRVHPEIIGQVIAAIKRAPTLSPVEQTALVLSLETALDYPPIPNPRS